MRGGGGGELSRGNSVSFSTLPSPFIPLVCYRINFLDEPTRKRLLYRLSCALVFFFLLAVAVRNPMSFDILVRLRHDFVSAKDS